MAVYTVNYSKLSGKYHPTAKVIGTVSMKKLAQRLSDRSTVTLSDAYAVLAEIGDVMSDFLAEGYSVELAGLGSFRYTIDSKKKGQDSADKVSSADINGVRLRFIPETTRNSDGTVASRAGIADGVTWTRWGDATASSATEEEDTSTEEEDETTNDSGSGSTDTGDSNPL